MEDESKGTVEKQTEEPIVMEKQPEKTTNGENGSKTPEKMLLEMKDDIWKLSEEDADEMAVHEKRKAEIDKLKADRANLEKANQEIQKVMKDNEAALPDLKCKRDKLADYCDDIQKKFEQELKEATRTEIGRIRDEKDTEIVTKKTDKENLVIKQPVGLPSSDQSIQYSETALANATLASTEKQKEFDDKKMIVSQLQADLKALEDLEKSINKEREQGNTEFAYVYFLDFEGKLTGPVENAIDDLEGSEELQKELEELWRQLHEAKKEVRTAEIELKKREQDLKTTEQELADLEKNRISNIFDVIKANAA